MGANAQTTVPTFTAGDVLTAAQMNQSARTGIPVFSSTANRDAGFGGTGEKTLAEGQLCYVEGTGLQSYNAAGSWVTWGAAPSSGLTLISTTTIGSAVSSVTVSNAFSSTYDNYEIIISGGVSSAADVLLQLTLGATATGYYSAGYYTGSSWGLSVNAARQSNAAFWNAGNGSTSSLSGSIRLIAPNLAKVTELFSLYNVTTTSGYTYVNSGFLNNTTQYTAFTITPTTGTLTGGTIKVYGFQNS